MEQVLTSEIAWWFFAGTLGVVAAFCVARSALWRRRKCRELGHNVIPLRRPRKRSKYRERRKQGRLQFSTYASGFCALLVIVTVSFLWPEIRFFVFPGMLEGRVTHVRDGDTIEVDGTAVRLSGINCDELGTSFGERAKTAATSLVSGRELSCRLNGEATYDRVVGRCEMADGRDLGQVLIERGVCGRCAGFDKLRVYAGISAMPFRGAEPNYCSWIW